MQRSEKTARETISRARRIHGLYRKPLRPKLALASENRAAQAAALDHHGVRPSAEK